MTVRADVRFGAAAGTGAAGTCVDVGSGAVVGGTVVGVDSYSLTPCATSKASAMSTVNKPGQFRSIPHPFVST